MSNDNNEKRRPVMFCSQCRNYWMRSFGQWWYVVVMDDNARPEICPECHRVNDKEPPAPNTPSPESPEAIRPEMGSGDGKAGGLYPLGPAVEIQDLRRANRVLREENARLRLLMMNAQMCPRCGGKGDFHGEKFICDNCVEVS